MFRELDTLMFYHEAYGLIMGVIFGGLSGDPSYL